MALRFDIAGALLLAYVILARDDWRPRTRRDITAILITGIPALGLSNALLFVGQQYTTSAVAAIVFSLAPVLTPLFAVALLSDESLSLRGAGGLLVGLCGVGLVVQPQPTRLLAGGATGQLILLCGAVSVALGSVLIRRADATLPSVVVTAWALPLGGVTLHLASLAAGESLGAVQWTPGAIVALGYVSVFAGAIAYTAYFELLAEAGAIQTNLINYFIPVVTTVLGWALLDETITLATIAGFLVIFAGFALLKARTLTQHLHH